MKLRIDKFENTWLFARQGKLPTGLTVDIEPVRAVLADDVKGLERALVWYANSPVEPLPPMKPAEFQEGLRSMAAGCINWAQYISKARLFQLELDTCFRLTEIFHQRGRHTGQKSLCEAGNDQDDWAFAIASCMSGLADRSASGPSAGFPIFSEFQAAWLALKSTNIESILKAIGAVLAGTCTMAEGLLESAKFEKIFLSPAISGWTIVAGLSLYRDGNLRALQNEVSRLSTIFERAEMFAHERTTEYVHWIKASDGKIERCFAYSGEKNEVFENSGDVTSVESHLDLFVQPASVRRIDEVDLEAIAAGWGVSPRNLIDSREMGILAFLTENAGSRILRWLTPLTRNRFGSKRRARNRSVYWTTFESKSKEE